MSKEKVKELTEEEKIKEYKEVYLPQLKKDLGVIEMEKDIKTILEWTKPKTESETAKDKTEKTTALDEQAQGTLEFIDQLGSIMQKYGVLKNEQAATPNEAAKQFESMLAKRYLDLIDYDLKRATRKGLKDE